MDLTAWTVDGLCSQVNQRPEQSRIDLSDVTFFSPYGLVYLGMFLRYHKARGKAFDRRGIRRRVSTSRQNFDVQLQSDS